MHLVTGTDHALREATRKRWQDKAECDAEAHALKTKAECEVAKRAMVDPNLAIDSCA